MITLYKKAEKHFLGVPSSLSWEEWEVWEKEQKKAKPIAYFLFWTFPTILRRQKRRMIDLYWWFIHRLVPRHKYHLIDTRLGAGYHEYDTRMLHGCFSLLKDYCEESLPSASSVDKKGKTKQRIAIEALDSYIAMNIEIDMSHHAELYKEIKELYIWWLDRTINPFYEDESFDDTNEVDNQMLLRLVKIRGFLWV